MKTQKFRISELVMSSDVQTRVALSKEAVEEYADRYREQKTSDKKKQWLPPIVVFMVGKTPYVVDGFHRVSAALQAGMTHLIAESRGTGTLDDARREALAHNHKHGVKRTNADKHRAARMAVELYPGDSDRALADRAGVSNQFISSVRAEQVSTVDSSNRVTTGNDSIDVFEIHDSGHPPAFGDWVDSEDIEDASKALPAPVKAKPREMRRGKDGKLYPAHPTAGKASTAMKRDQALVDAGREVKRALAFVNALFKEETDPHIHGTLRTAIKELESCATGLIYSERVPCPACVGITKEVPNCSYCKSTRVRTRRQAMDAKASIESRLKHGAA